MTESLLQFGGLGLAAFVILAWAKYVFNHQKHLQQSHKESMDTVVGVVKDNTKAMTTLNNLVERDIDATKDLKDIILKNGKK